MEREPRAATSRVTLAIVGALIAASIGAALAIMPPVRLGFVGAAPLAAAHATPTASDTAQDQPTETPTAPIATPRPTATRRPCVPTSPLQGSIVAVPPNTSQNSFTLRVCGATKTILVDANTTYSGAAHQFSDLRIGWQAEVTCVQQSASTYLASHVNAQIDN
jgi:hypothetical protein